MNMRSFFSCLVSGNLFLSESDTNETQGKDPMYCPDCVLMFASENISQRETNWFFFSFFVFPIRHHFQVFSVCVRVPSDIVMICSSLLVFLCPKYAGEYEILGQQNFDTLGKPPFSRDVCNDGHIWHQALIYSLHFLLFDNGHLKSWTTFMDPPLFTSPFQLEPNNNQVAFLKFFSSVELSMTFFFLNVRRCRHWFLLTIFHQNWFGHRHPSQLVFHCLYQSSECGISFPEVVSGIKLGVVVRGRMRVLYL